jgi:hypothetical protein
MEKVVTVSEAVTGLSLAYLLIKAANLWFIDSVRNSFKLLGCDPGRNTICRLGPGQEPSRNPDRIY